MPSRLALLFIFNLLAYYIGLFAVGPEEPAMDTFAEKWIYSSETSALIYWHMDSLKKEATSYVEYGETSSYGHQTPTNQVARWAHFHGITGLDTNTTYHFRMVMIESNVEIKGNDTTFTTSNKVSAIHLPLDGQTPPYKLDQSNTTYILTSDITAPGTGIEFSGDAENVILDLDGHTITFAQTTSDQCYGVLFGDGVGTLCNGTIIQGDSGGDYSTCISSRWRATPREIFGITTDTDRPNGHPLKFLGRCGGVNIHHNHFTSHVTEIESRHYPGNGLMILDGIEGAANSIHHNLLTEGCHIGIKLSSDSSATMKVYRNDIKHHQQYVNGYAIMAHAPGVEVYLNRISSTGRSIHITRPYIKVHDNWMSTRGQMTLDDMPPKTYPFLERMIELHGIKFEGTLVCSAYVYNNFMRIIQPLPDSTGAYVPATPLNFGEIHNDGMNEVYNNRFESITDYKDTHHGPYGESGEWASSLYIVSEGSASSSPDYYAASIHDNEFFSNDIFVGAGTSSLLMTMPVFDNTFILAANPTNDRDDFYRINDAMQAEIRANNTFITTGALWEKKNTSGFPNIILKSFSDPLSSNLIISYSFRGNNQHIRLDIYDMQGKLIHSLVNNTHTPGTYQIIWNMCDKKNTPLSSGLYLLHLKAVNFQVSSKIVLF